MSLEHIERTFLLLIPITNLYFKIVCIEVWITIYSSFENICNVFNVLKIYVMYLKYVSEKMYYYI